MLAKVLSLHHITIFITLAGVCILTTIKYAISSEHHIIYGHTNFIISNSIVSVQRRQGWPTERTLQTSNWSIRNEDMGSSVISCTDCKFAQKAKSSGVTDVL